MSWFKYIKYLPIAFSVLKEIYNIAEDGKVTFDEVTVAGKRLANKMGFDVVSYNKKYKKENDNEN